MYDVIVCTGAGSAIAMTTEDARHRLSIGDPTLTPVPGAESLFSAEPAMLVRFPTSDGAALEGNLTAGELLRVLNHQLTDGEIADLLYVVGEHPLWDR
jgi:hypothetical protein